ncbi:MAG TPA: DoxX family protein [Burkholderiales bacterium]|nr:DoxX family protein [Burkholderiales bacterium]
MKYPFQSDDAGKLILRLTVGGLILFHGVSKLMNPAGAMGMISGMLSNMGMPVALAYGVYIGEVLAPLLLIFGVFTRIGGLLVVGNMLFALTLAHTTQIFTLSKQGGWGLELQGFYLFCGLAIYFLGSGRFAARPD